MRGKGTDFTEFADFTKRGDKVMGGRGKTAGGTPRRQKAAEITIENKKTPQARRGDKVTTP
jgi:hypothetical protein